MIFNELYRQKLAALIRYLIAEEGFTYKEIGKVLNYSGAQVKCIAEDTET